MQKRMNAMVTEAYSEEEMAVLKRVLGTLISQPRVAQ